MTPSRLLDPSPISDFERDEDWMLEFSRRIRRVEMASALGALREHDMAEDAAMGKFDALAMADRLEADERKRAERAA